MPYIVFTANITHVMDARNMLGSAYSLQGLQDLKDMSACHGFARKAINIITMLAKNWGITLENPIPGSDASTEALDADPISPLTVDTQEMLPTLRKIQEPHGPNWVLPKPLFHLFPNQGVPKLEFAEKEDGEPLSMQDVGSIASKRSIEAKLKIRGFEFATVDNTATLTEGAFQQYGTYDKVDHS
jgi:hypothetical protein